MNFPVEKGHLESICVFTCTSKSSYGINQDNTLIKILAIVWVYMSVSKLSFWIKCVQLHDVGGDMHPFVFAFFWLTQY